MNEVEKIFRDYVQSKGLKFTPERQAILNHVFECHEHFEAEELLIDMRKNNKRVSKATIYRTLALLVNSGLLREVIFGEKHAHYEHVYGHEHHEHLHPAIQRQYPFHNWCEHLLIVNHCNNGEEHDQE